MKHLKQEFDKLTFKEALVYSMAYICLITSFVLLFVGMYTAPQGEIHDSVLYAYGLTLFFVGSLLGITMHFSDETKRFKQTVLDLLHKYNISPDKDSSSSTGNTETGEEKEINLNKH